MARRSALEVFVCTPRSRKTLKRGSREFVANQRGSTLFFRGLLVARQDGIDSEQFAFIRVNPRPGCCMARRSALEVFVCTPPSRKTLKTRITRICCESGAEQPQFFQGLVIARQDGIDSEQFAFFRVNPRPRFCMARRSALEVFVCTPGSRKTLKRGITQSFANQRGPTLPRPVGTPEG